MKSVSILGASGLVGGRLIRRLHAAGGDRLVATGTCFRSRPGPGMASLDVTDPAALAAHLAPGFDFVVVAAGTKDVRRCEEDPAFARALNATPVEEILRIVQRERHATRVVYLSTDYVFDGERGRYCEDDPVRPQTAYGRSKALGERAVLGAGERHKVVRSAAVMARGATFFDWLLGELAREREVPLYDDCYFSPTPAELFCEMMLELLCAYDEVPRRIVHAVGERRLSRHAFGRLVAGLTPTTRAKIVPVRRVASGPLLQPDLSLVPSEVVRAWRTRSFEAYLADEIDAALAEGSLAASPPRR